MSHVTLTRGIGFGLVGGLVGTVGVDLLMVGKFSLMGLPADTFFGWWGMVANTFLAMIGVTFGDGVSTGLALHYLPGLVKGLIFGALVSQVGFFHIDTAGKGVGLGVLVELVTLPLASLPIAMILDVPLAMLFGFAFVPHLVYGTVLGGVTSYGLRSEVRHP